MSFVYERPDADVIDGEWTDSSAPPTQTIYDKIDETTPGEIFLCHFEGTDGSTTFVDSSTFPNVITPSGNAQIDNAQFKFGSTSGLFDGSGDYLTVTMRSDFAVGYEDLTVDFWVRFNS